MQLRSIHKLLKPTYIIERTAKEVAIRRLRKRFKGTPASRLPWDLLGNAELLFALQDKGIKIIFDIGAHVGNWSIMAKSVFSAARIDAFEPIPSSVDLFKKTVEGLPDIYMHPCALGSAKGEASMSVLGNQADCSSVLSPAEDKPMMAGQDRGDKIKVSIKRLDDMVADEGLPYPDFIKMDVQGFELEVLKGAEECLKHAKAVQSEVSFEEFYKDQALFRDVLDFLDDRGFKLCMFANYDPSKPFGQPDALFVKIASAEA
jgi:FkbM family methyltransferase